MNGERGDALGGCKEGLWRGTFDTAEKGATENLGTEGPTGRGREAGVKG